MVKFCDIFQGCGKFIEKEVGGDRYAN